MSTPVFGVKVMRFVGQEHRNFDWKKTLNIIPAAIMFPNQLVAYKRLWETGLEYVADCFSSTVKVEAACSGAVVTAPEKLSIKVKWSKFLCD